MSNEDVFFTTFTYSYNDLCEREDAAIKVNEQKEEFFSKNPFYDIVGEHLKEVKLTNIECLDKEYNYTTRLRVAYRMKESDLN